MATVAGGSAVLAGVQMGSFVLYGLALAFYFRRDGSGRLAAAVIALAGLAGTVMQFIAILQAQEPSWLRLLAGLGGYAGGLAIFAAAIRSHGARRLTVAFSQDAPQWLVSEGIYRRIRHPLYASYLLSWLAGVLAAPGVMTITPAVLMGLVYTCAARAEERKFAASPLAADYSRYRRGAGMFWPKWSTKA